MCVWSHHHLELSRSISENRRQFLKGALFPGAQQPGGVVFQAAWLGAPRDEACGDRQWGAACTEPTLPLCVGRAWVSGSKDLGPFAEGNRVRDAAGDPPALSPSSGHPRAQPTLGAARPMVGGGTLPRGTSTRSLPRSGVRMKCPPLPPHPHHHRLLPRTALCTPVLCQGRHAWCIGCLSCGSLHLTSKQATPSPAHCVPDRHTRNTQRAPQR